MAEIYSLRPGEQEDQAPHNIEAEQQLIGAVLADNTRAAMLPFLKPDHFYEQLHQDLYREILIDMEHGKEVTPVTLVDRFRAHPSMDEMGGVQYMTRLLGGSMAGFAFEEYAEIVYDLASKRRLQEYLRSVQDKIRSGWGVHEIVKDLDKDITTIDLRGKEASVSLMRAVTRTAERLYGHVEGGTTGGVPTGLVRLDERLGGLYNGDLIVLAGRPSMGKTALATSIALRVARSGTPVCFVSAEMSEEALVHRFLSEISGVPYFMLRKPTTMSPEELEDVKLAVNELAHLPVEIIPDSSIDIDTVRTGCRRVQRQFNGHVGLVIVDYLQMLKADGRQQQERIANVSVGLKRMAKEMDVPVLALSQLSRSVESRDDKRPMLSDLRDSGQIEQDADVVLFCYREYYYLSREKPKAVADQCDWEVELSRIQDQMQLICAKQRMGSTGTDRIGCDVKVNRFWDYDDVEETDIQEEIAF